MSIHYWQEALAETTISQSIPLKKGCAFSSCTPFTPEPSLSLGLCFNNWNMKSTHSHTHSLVWAPKNRRQETRNTNNIMFISLPVTLQKCHIITYLSLGLKYFCGLYDKYSRFQQNLTTCNNHYSRMTILRHNQCAFVKGLWQYMKSSGQQKGKASCYTNQTYTLESIVPATNIFVRTEQRTKICFFLMHKTK